MDSSCDQELLPLQDSSIPETTPANSNLMLSSLQKCKGWNAVTMTCVMIAVFLNNVAFSTVGPFYPREAEKRGVSSTVVGVIIGCSTLFAALLSPFSGYIMPRMGFAVPTFFGLLLTGLAYVSLGFVNLISSQWAFILMSLLLRILEGVGSALFFTAACALIPILYPKHVGALFGVFELACGLGFSFGYVIGGFLYKVGGFKLPFIIVGACILLITIPCTLLVWHVKAMEGKSARLSFKTTLSIATDVIMVVLVLAIVVSAMATTFYTPILEPFLRKQFNYDSVQTSLVFLIQSISYMAISLVIGPLVDKLGYNRHVSVFGLFLSAAVLILMGTLYDLRIMSPYIIGVAFIILGAGSSMGLVPVFGDLLKTSEKYLGERNHSDELTAYVSGLVPFSYCMGEFLGNFVGGTLRNFLSFPSTSILVGELILAEALLLLGVTIVSKATPREEKAVAS